MDARTAGRTQTLIEDAAGIDVKRGDSLTINMMAFAVPTLIDEPVMPWWQEPSTFRWAELLGIGLLSLLVLWFGVRPLMKRYSRKGSENLPLAISSASADEALDHVDTGVDGAESSPRTENAFSASSLWKSDDLPEQGSGLETKIAHLQQLAQSETERTAEVIKQWINSNERIKSQPE